jgi:hypothetical protein
MVMALSLSAVSGCQYFKEPSFDKTPNRAIASIYVAVDMVAETALMLHEQGAISDTLRAEIRVALQGVIDDLRDVETLLGDGQQMDAEDRLAQVEMSLRAVRSLLREETQ